MTSRTANLPKKQFPGLISFKRTGCIMLWRLSNESRNSVHCRDHSGERLAGQPISNYFCELLPPWYVIAFFFSVGNAHAENGEVVFLNNPSEQPSSGPKNWALQVTPYLWLAQLNGHVSPFQRGPTIRVEKSFSDIVDNLNLGGFINILGRRDRFVFSGDIMYVDTTDIHGVGPLPALSVPGVGMIPSGGNLDAKVDTKQFTATLMGGYRIIDAPKLRFDVLAGARFWHISNSIKVTGSHGDMTGSASYDESFGWTDPLIGFRAFIPITHQFSVQSQADIGGFGVGSDFTWSTLVTVNYALEDSFSASIGYKLLDVNYDYNGQVYDTQLRGPAIGMTYRF